MELKDRYVDVNKIPINLVTTKIINTAFAYYKELRNSILRYKLLKINKHIKSRLLQGFIIKELSSNPFETLKSSLLQKPN